MTLGESLPPSCEPQVLQDIKCYSSVESYMWFRLSKVCDELATRLWVKINFTIWFLEIKMDTYQEDRTQPKNTCVSTHHVENVPDLVCCQWVAEFICLQSHPLWKMLPFPSMHTLIWSCKECLSTSVMRSVHMEHITSEPGIVTNTRLNFLPQKKHIKLNKNNELVVFWTHHPRAESSGHREEAHCCNQMCPA